MVFQASDEKDVDGNLLGLILLWKCAHCEIKNITWLIRREAVTGKKNASCTSCEGKNLVRFISCEIKSDREKKIEQALPFIPFDDQKHIFEDLALTEALFNIEGCEEMAESYWQSLQRQINYWVQQDRSTMKKY
jgi:hypothetical protein